jgi:hypothetical protein
VRIGAAELDRILSQLKDFQRSTVDYVFRRMYLDVVPAHRFLVADEVGLGKTMVARGIIARTLHHLADRVSRIDVVYVCSNAAIAEQNINRLNVLGWDHAAVATRLTMLPVLTERLSRNRVNFVSFTPGTTFDLKSRGGRKEERAVLFRMLATQFPQNRTPLFNLLQCNAGPDSWRWTVDHSRERIDPRLSARFADRIRANLGLMARLEDGCRRYASSQTRPGWEDNEFRYDLIGGLRHLLARVCVDALEPDLVILDEFQRFKDLLHGENEAAELAQALLSYQSSDGEAVRVLLLSATPYRMLSLNHEAADDHHADFLRTLEFLFEDATCPVWKMTPSSTRPVPLTPVSSMRRRSVNVRGSVISSFPAAVHGKRPKVAPGLLVVFVDLELGVKVFDVAPQFDRHRRRNGGEDVHRAVVAMCFADVRQQLPKLVAEDLQPLP